MQWLPASHVQGLHCLEAHQARIWPLAAGSLPPSSLRPLLPSLFSWWALCAKSHAPPLCWVQPWASWVWAWPMCWRARPPSTHARWWSPSHTRCSQGSGKCQTLLTWHWMLSWAPASSRWGMPQSHADRDASGSQCVQVQDHSVQVMHSAAEAYMLSCSGGAAVAHDLLGLIMLCD